MKIHQQHASYVLGHIFGQCYSKWRLSTSLNKRWFFNRDCTRFKGAMTRAKNTWTAHSFHLLICEMGWIRPALPTSQANIKPSYVPCKMIYKCKGLFLWNQSTDGYFLFIDLTEVQDHQRLVYSIIIYGPFYLFRLIIICIIYLDKKTQLPFQATPSASFRLVSVCVTSTGRSQCLLKWAILGA